MKGRDTLKTVEKKTIKTLIITLSLMIGALGAGYLTFVNESSQNGYALEQQQLKNSTLKDELQKLKKKITDTVSLHSLKENEKVKKMESPEEKEFITAN